jgi:ectoine hydroxylase-related dioxygenase (phytanoyl-CoA dioxygenase family)
MRALDDDTASAIVHLDARTARVEEIVAVIDRDGAIILDRALTPAQVDAILSELEPFIAGTAPIPDDFVGRKTTRTGALVARSESVREVVLDPKVLSVVSSILCRHSSNIQLSVTQIMRLLPGQPAQQLHRDRYLWSASLPGDIEPLVDCIFAMTDFTEANGATRIVPGSHRWEFDRAGSHDESVPAEMSRGSVVIYTGSVVHGAGENTTNSPRIGMYFQYLLAWLRQEENQYLSCPPEVAKDLEPELQALLGYTTGNDSLGYFSPLEPSAEAVDILLADVAVGNDADIAEQQPF